VNISLHKLLAAKVDWWAPILERIHDLGHCPTSTRY